MSLCSLFYLKKTIKYNPLYAYYAKKRHIKSFFRFKPGTKGHRVMVYFLVCSLFAIRYFYAMAFKRLAHVTR